VVGTRISYWVTRTNALEYSGDDSGGWDKD